MLREEYQKKNGKVWETTFTTEDPAKVYEDLAHALASKYVEKAGYVKRVVREQRYTHKTYTVYFDNGGRYVFTVGAHF